ncbi:MAG TPA: peptide-methionine (R)-S-oxide reductase MsrB [Acetobacteraceae bacterium]|nr:peptide-methionine (R)-S-oxide reductase MsrB [Acetobacteraceae bacterium]
MTRRGMLGNTALGLLAGSAALLGLRGRARAVEHFAVTHTDAEWHKLLTADQYYVLRQQGTEAPGSSPLDHQFAKGRYDCAGCAQHLFGSDTKFDSGTGWPSFWAPLPHAVSEEQDDSLMMQRTEVHCARCGGHLGHVFDDGPKPTGLRYCMNGVALKFVPA